VRARSANEASARNVDGSLDGGRCPRCGTAAASGQEYCLNCGERLPDALGVVPALSSAWRRRLPYPGDWMWPALVGLLVAGLATAVAVVVRDSGQRGDTIVATQPPAQAPTPPPAATEPPEATVPAQPTEPPNPRPRATRRATKLVEWPRGTSGYTIVLESIPTTSGRRLARRKARAALNAGLEDVGILNSSRYPSLIPGYFVVFSGIFEQLADAQRPLATARENGYRAAYARPITF
jgi:hypothetical protein